MNKKISISLILTLAVLLLLVACSESKTYEGEPDFKGVILKFEEDEHVLMDIQSGWLFEEGYDTGIYLSYDEVEGFSELEEGQELKIWLGTEILDSNPPIAGIGKYEVIE